MSAPRPDRYAVCVLVPALVVLVGAVPTVDGAFEQLCRAQQAPADFCATLARCAPGKRGECAGDDRATATDDWWDWRCTVDREYGYLECESGLNFTSGPGEGDRVREAWQAAIFVSRGAVTVGVSTLGDRPAIAFLRAAGEAWVPVKPMPELTPRAFGLPRPRIPPALGEGQRPVELEFFVEVTLPQVGTALSVEGRWVDTFRDDSGYGQADQLIASAKVELEWDAVKGVFRRRPAAAKR